MTRDECVAIIQQQLGFRTTLTSQIITNLKLAQDDLEGLSGLPWFLISEDAYAHTVAGEQRLPIPTDFLMEIDPATLRYLPDNVGPSDPELDLIKNDYDTLRTLFFDPDTGTTKVGPPEAYALVGNYFRIFPTPDDIYTLHMIYYAADQLLDTNIENNWLKYFPKLLMGLAGKMLASPLRDAGAYAEFSRWETEGRRSLVSFTVTRDLANQNLQVGGAQ